MAERFDAIVIGAGVIGSSVALELARGGRSVLVVDKGPGAGTGSTSASSAIIRFSYSTRDAILTAWEGAALWEDWADHLGHVDPDGLVTFTRLGTLVFTTTGYDGSRMGELWTEFGIEHEFLGPDELAARFPYLDVGKYYPPKVIDDPAFADDATERLSAWYEPSAGFIDDPSLAARNLAYAARQHGAGFRFHAAVAAIEDGAPLVADLDIGQYFRPQPGRQIWIGGTEPECDEMHWVDDPDSNSDYPTVEVWETAMMRMARRMPEFGVPSQPNGIASMYDASDDWVPIYDRSSLHGFFMACGTSGNQFKNAPMAGQYLREIVDATMSGHDHDADPIRFRGARTGREIDLGAFSRRLQPADTTHSVMG